MMILLALATAPIINTAPNAVKNCFFVKPYNLLLFEPSSSSPSLSEAKSNNLPITEGTAILTELEMRIKRRARPMYLDSGLDKTNSRLMSLNPEDFEFALDNFKVGLVDFFPCAMSDCNRIDRNKKCFLCGIIKLISPFWYMGGLNNDLVEYSALADAN
ncbi:hypothetical protein AWRI1631_122280 [Saccharomyces cerevisiae AWRI1631]|uniref:Uncharacterized protein n=1 Tax=Saccharomyces cerevisiae (strain AWRI1631) TaxID=545124 RepID=B5VNA6_YEAS6|nr:hypothetical protein AWRI1631_122280 [Saccharomyces cerevisiae AWRI1631]